MVRSRGYVAWISLVAVLGVLGCSAVIASARATRSSQPSARQLSAEAYIYGVGLVYEQRVISHFPADTLVNVTQLSTPAETLIPAPNVDTLYTVARLELGTGPLVVHVPEEHGRYYVLQILDAYTNTFAYVGRRTTGTHPGNYAIVGPGWHGQLPAGVKRIQAPTPTVWVLGRTLVEGPQDIPNAQAIQHGYTLTPLNRYGGPPLSALYLPKSVLQPSPVPQGLAFFDQMDALLAADPPPPSDAALLRSFASIGLGPGRSPSTEKLSNAVRADLLAGISDGTAEINRYADKLSATSERAHNGWVVPPPDTGDYGSDYLLRAYIAINALAANVPAEAIYPFAYVDQTGAPLSGRHRYVLHFAAGELPPVEAFWSLTMYDQQLFLVPNQLDRYAIGNRTPGLHFGRDGSLDILIQHSPPRGSRSNWLPAPSGVFALALRLYQPKPSARNGTWPLPTVTRVG